MFDLTVDTCQLYIPRCEINKVPTSIKDVFEKFAKIIPCRLYLQLHSTDYTMIGSSHFHAFVTTEVQHTVPLCSRGRIALSAILLSIG